MTKTLKAVNWNDPSCKFYDDIYKKQTQQFWLPEEIPVSDDKECWSNLDDKTKETYERILAGLTLLDTNQTTGINKVAEKSDNMFIQSLLALFGGFESIHARSYSTIFQTLCTTERIDELFAWVEQVEELQDKLSQIVKQYNTQDNLYMSYVASLCLEGICFYSGFFLPLYLAGQGKMIHSGEIINLIMRDEKLHTLACGKFAQDLLTQMDVQEAERNANMAVNMINEIYDLELQYSYLLYNDLGLYDEVKTYVQFNVNYALSCLGYETLLFDVTETDINPVVMNGYSIETKNHDFFSTKGNGYVVATKVDKLTDDVFYFGDM